MTGPVTPPFRRAFDASQSPFAARNALGITDTSGAPTDAEYIVAVDDPTLTSDRVLTNTATVTWDLTTPGQAKANTAGAASSADFPAGAWTAWTPTVSSSSGTITSYTVNRARYTHAGKTITAYFDFTISNSGTGTGTLLVTLPVIVATSGGGMAVGQEIVSFGFMVGGRLLPTNSAIPLLQVNGATPIGTGNRYVGIAIYESD